MDKLQALAALEALGQEHRLSVYALLARAGPGGMTAGEVAKALGLAANTLSFHFTRLRRAGLVTVVRCGRSLIYTARNETMHRLLTYLGSPSVRPPRSERRHRQPD